MTTDFRPCKTQPALERGVAPLDGCAMGQPTLSSFAHEAWSKDPNVGEGKTRDLGVARMRSHHPVALKRAESASRLSIVVKTQRAKTSVGGEDGRLVRAVKRLRSLAHEVLAKTCEVAPGSRQRPA